MVLLFSLSSWAALGGGVETGGAPDWPAAGGGSGRAGNYPGEFYLPAAVAWTAEAGPSATAPVAAEGVVYIGNGAGEVKALDAASGRLIWNVKPGGAVSAGPAVSGGLVFIGTAAGRIQALAAADGRLAWSAPCGAAAVQSLAVEGSRVLASCALPETRLICLEAAGGKTAWAKDFSAGLMGEICVQSGTILAATRRGLVYGLDPDRGRIRWERNFGGSAFEGSAAALGGGRAIVAPGGFDRGLYGMDLRTGRADSVPYAATPAPAAAPVRLFREMQRMRPERRTVMLQKLAARSPDLAKGLGEGGFVAFGEVRNSGCALAGDALYFVQQEEGYQGYQSTLRALDRRTGKVRWERKEPAAPAGAPVAPMAWGGKLIAPAGGDVGLYDRMTGALLARVAVGSAPAAAPALYNDRIFVLTGGGVLAAIKGSRSAFVPEAYGLSGNYPNPFNPVTNIQYALPERTPVRLAVYNVRGQELIQLVNAEKRAGYYTAQWNGRDRLGRALPSGLYVYRLTTPKFVKAERMVLVK